MIRMLSVLVRINLAIAGELACLRPGKGGLYLVGVDGGGADVSAKARF